MGDTVGDDLETVEVLQDVVEEEVEIEALV